MSFLKGTGHPQSPCQNWRQSAQFETVRTAESLHSSTKVCLPESLPLTLLNLTMILNLTPRSIIICYIAQQNLRDVWNLLEVYEKALRFFGGKYFVKCIILLLVYFKQQKYEYVWMWPKLVTGYVFREAVSSLSRVNQLSTSAV